jgi:hypothetical protein
MKVKFFFLMGLLVFSGMVFGQTETKQSKKEAMEAKVKKAVDSGRYELVVNQAHPLRGGMIALTSEYTLTFANDSLTVYLPYFGRAYSAPMNGEGGIKFSETVSDRKTVFEKKKKRYTINCSVKAKEDTYRFAVSIWLNGSASINIVSNNRQSIDFSGEVSLPD